MQSAFSRWVNALVFLLLAIGPDLTGSFGAFNGTGGLEAVISPTGTIGAINDRFGNLVASVSANQTLAWSRSKLGSYGVLPNSESPTLEQGASLIEASAWRTRRTDPTGFINMGARHYEPTTGRFLSADPLGHSSSWNLYDFANGDAVNGFDADGRIATGVGNGVVLGDYYQPATGAQMLGQVLGQVALGFTPAGIAGDVRDATAALGEVSNNGLGWRTGAGVAMAGVAFIPGAGDAVKGVVKGIVNAFPTATVIRTLPTPAPKLPDVETKWVDLNVPDAKTENGLMVHPFSGGGTHITTSVSLATHTESATFGAADGLFLAPTRQIDGLLASGASRSQIEITLGLNQGSLAQGTLMRIDISNPFARTLSLPTSGNIFFRPGLGMTWGGLNEGIITSPFKNDPGVILQPIQGL